MIVCSRTLFTVPTYTFKLYILVTQLKFAYVVVYSPLHVSTLQCILNRFIARMDMEGLVAQRG